LWNIASVARTANGSIISEADQLAAAGDETLIRFRRSLQSTALPALGSQHRLNYGPDPTAVDFAEKFKVICARVDGEHSRGSRYGSDSARMIEDKIHDEWVKLGGPADFRVIVNYDEETGEWKARPARDDLPISYKLAFVTAVNRALQQHKLVIKVQLSPR
jgi:hypothetical protein